jgi:hypothetical protein
MALICRRSELLPKPQLISREEWLVPALRDDSAASGMIQQTSARRSLMGLLWKQKRTFVLFDPDSAAPKLTPQCRKKMNVFLLGVSRQTLAEVGK